MATPANSLTLTVGGVGDLLEAFQAIGSIGTRDALRNALKRAMKPMKEAAEALAPVGTEERSVHKKKLRDSIIIRTTLSRSQKAKRGGKRAVAEVFLGSSAPHAHLVEFGHRQVVGKTRKGTAVEWDHRRDRQGRWIRHRVTKRADDAIAGKVVGHVPKHPFLRPAFDSRKGEAIKIFGQEIANEVKRVATRYGRQAAKGKLSRGAREAFSIGLDL